MNNSSNDFSPIQAVVFDLDGLVVDSETLFFEVGIELLARRGRQFNSEMMQLMIGRRAPEAFAILIEREELEDSAAQLEQESREIFYDLMPNRLRTMPGLGRLLDCISETDLPSAIATSSSRDYTERVLDQFDLKDHFEFLVTSEDVTRGKPDPEIYRKAADTLQLEPPRILVLEDSQAGLTAAKAAGVLCAVVPSPYLNGVDWSGADYLLNRLDDTVLIDFIRRAH